MANSSDTCETEETEHFINSIIAHSIPKAITLSELVDASRNDPTLQCVAKCITNNRWTKTECLKPYQKIKHELTTKRGLVMKGTTLIIPEVLQNRTLELAHETHQGITKTKSLLREKVWWPSINTDIEKLIQGCLSCLSVADQTNTEPMKSTFMGEPWQKVHIDICGPFPTGESVLGIIDSATRWPDLHIISSTTSREITKRLRRSFATHGIPEEIVTDNAPNLTSVDVSRFCVTNGIKHHRSIPYWPQGNAEIERFYRTLGKAVKTMHVDGRDWREGIFSFLLAYRNTPHSTTSKSPAKLLMRRSLRDKIPSVKTPVSKEFREAQALEKEKKQKAKHYFDNTNKAKPIEIHIGDRVLMQQLKQNKLTSRYDHRPYKVIERRGCEITIQRNDKRFKRHVSSVKKIPSYATEMSSINLDSDDSDAADIFTEEEQVTNENNNEAEQEYNNEAQQEDITPIRRSTRERRLPNRFGDFISG